MAFRYGLAESDPPGPLTAELRARWAGTARRHAVWFAGGMTPTASATLLASGVLALSVPVVAQDSAQHTPELELQRVTMLRAGVASFELEGRATDGEIALRVADDTLNDVLQTLVVRDAAGALSAVEFPTSESPEELLESLAIDVREDPSLGQLLRQVRGIEVTLDASSDVTGTVVSVVRNEADEGGPVEVVNLLTDGGLRAVPLDEVDSIRLHDERTVHDIRHALGALASRYGRSDRVLRLRLRDDAEADRAVRLAYVHEVPVWKATWRLVLPAEGDPVLRGWGIVDNVGARDWEGVRLTLVSGRPISFVMPLREPIHVERPSVDFELFRGLSPRRHEQALEMLEAAGDPQRDRKAVAPEHARRALGPATAGPQAGGGMAFAARAASREVGEVFHYEIEDPVTLARDRSAMLPIVEASVTVERLSLFDRSVHDRHPLRAARVENTSGIDLVGGPVTVFVEGEYTGEALMSTLSAGDSRLLGYALDLEVEVDRSESTEPRSLRSVRVVDGTLHTVHRRVRSISYSVRNSDDEPRHLVIEAPDLSGFEVVEPQPIGTTRDAHRFALDVEASSGAGLDVRYEKVEREQVALTDVDDARIALIVDAPNVDADTKEALRHVVDEQQRIQALESRLDQVRGEIQSIVADQQRIRGNLEQIGEETTLYQRYLDKLASQEDRIESLRSRADELEREIRSKRQELREWLAGLTIGGR